MRCMFHIFIGIILFLLSSCGWDKIHFYDSGREMPLSGIPVTQFVDASDLEVLKNRDILVLHDMEYTVSEEKRALGEKLIREVIAKLVAEKNFRGVTRRFESLPGWGHFKGAATIICFRMNGMIQKGDDLFVPLRFGYRSEFINLREDFKTEVPVHPSHALVLSYFIPIDKERKKEPVPSVEAVVKLIKLTNSSIHWLKNSVFRFTMLPSDSRSPSEIDDEFLMGIERVNLAFECFRNNKLIDYHSSGFAFNSFEFMILSAGGPLNRNFSRQVRMPFSISVENLYYHLILVEAFEYPPVRNARPACWRVGNEKIYLYQQDWLKEVQSMIDRYEKLSKKGREAFKRQIERLPCKP